MIVPFLKKNGRYCLVESKTCKAVSSSEFDKIRPFREGFAAALLNGRWVYIDSGGGFLNLEHDYTHIGDFENGIAVVYQDNTCNFINKDGREITRMDYREPYRVKHGFINVISLLAAGEYGMGLIDRTGFEVVKPEKGHAIFLQDDFILIAGKNYYEGRDFNGQLLFRTDEYAYISSFYKNRAIAQKKKNKEFLIINLNLEIIKEFQFTKYFHIKGNDKYGDALTDGFINGVIAYRKEKKWGLMNTEGEVVCDFRYDELLPFDGYSIAGVMKNNSLVYGVLGSDFRELTSLKYDEIRPYYESCAAVQLNGKWGFIDLSGKEIIPAEFHRVGDFKNGLVNVGYGDFYRKDFRGIFGVYNMQGEKICPFIYDWISDFEADYAVVRYCDKYGVIDKMGKRILDTQFDSISLPDNNELFLVEKNNKTFFVNNKSEEFTEEYQENRKPFW